MDKVIKIDNIKNKENKYLIKFNRPYKFEGTDYNEVDLSGIEKLSTKDLAEADKTFLGTGQLAIMNEMSTGYVCILASIIAKKPIEFFEGLPAKEGIKVKAIIGNFLFN